MSQIHYAEPKLSRKKIRRGPRPLPNTPETNDPGRRVLFPELLGQVLRLARQSDSVEQVQIARWLDIPTSTVSNLERGALTATVFHMDAFAAALNVLSSDINMPFTERPPWDGWEFHWIASQIARRLEKRGYVLVWATAPIDTELHLYTRDRQLDNFVRRLWPEDLRSRL